MAIALLFALFVTSTGFAAVRALGLAKGTLVVGLAPGVGISALAIVSSWIALLRLPPPVAGIAFGVAALYGLALALRERKGILEAARALWREQWPAFVTLVGAMVVPLILMATAFSGVQVPLSSHDGAAYIEVVEVYRYG